jgi:hypothetical protein
MNIYNKRGTWYLMEEGKELQTFSTEAAAIDASNGIKCNCEDCKCDPCECSTGPIVAALASLNTKFPKTLESLDDELLEEN